MTMLGLMSLRKSNLSGISMKMILRMKYTKKVSHQLNSIKMMKMNSKRYLVEVFSIGTVEISSSLLICVRYLEGIAVIFTMIYLAKPQKRFKHTQKYSGKTILKLTTIKSTLIKLKKEKQK